jgi:oleate hydratase
VTPGSVTADSSYGDDDRVPELIQDKRDGSRRQWDKIVTKAATSAGARPVAGDLP